MTIRFGSLTLIRWNGSWHVLGRNTAMKILLEKAQ